jgi:hypothetical protein
VGTSRCQPGDQIGACVADVLSAGRGGCQSSDVRRLGHGGTHG